MFVTLILVIFFLIIFILLSFVTVNYLFKNMVASFLPKENFSNYENVSFPKKRINEDDNCKKIDKLGNNLLQTQTGTNIPLSQTEYENYVGIIYDDIKNKENNELKKGKYCLYKNELMYDGIWKSDMKNPKKGVLFQDWKLTNGNVMSDYYCSDKLIQTNKKIPKNYQDNSSVYDFNDGKYVTYYNDCLDDPNDIQLSCFPTVFNKGISSSTKNFLSN